MVYQEIIQGGSHSPKGYYVKHLCELEQIELTRKRLEFIHSYIEHGIPTESERIERLKQDEDWSNEKEEDIKAYRQTISDNEKMILGIIPQQQPAIRKLIDENRKTLSNLLIERRNLIGITSEELANKDSSYFLAYLSLFKDPSFSKPLFNRWEEFEALDEVDSSGYLEAIDIALEKITEQNIRRISALPFFLNAFSYSKESIYTFLNKPISLLTNFQVHLFSLGSRNLNIISQAEGSPPDYFDKVCADEIIKWYDTQYQIILSKRNKH